MSIEPSTLEKELIEIKQTGGNKAHLDDVVNMTNLILGNDVLASASSGEMTLIPISTVGLGLPQVNLEPFKYLLNGMVRILSGAKNAFKHKKQLLSIIILTITWLATTILPIFGFSPSTFHFLNFLTFAQGGLDNGISGIIGGAIGKGVFVYFLFTLIMPGKGTKMFAGVGAGVKNLFGSLAVKNLKMLALILMGISAALFTYKFMTGDATLQNSMAGIAAFFISARALANKAGFLRGFITSIFNKYFKSLSKDMAYVNRLIAGWTVGFGFAVLLSALGIGTSTSFFAIMILIGAVILAIVSGKRKEGVVQ